MKQTFWDRDPKTNLAKFQRKARHPSHAFIPWDVKSGHFKNMLECGFGFPLVAKFITERGLPIKYVGLERTAAFLKPAATEFSNGQISFVQGDMENLSILKDGSFDLVYTRHTLEHLSHYVGPVKEFRRIARIKVVIILSAELMGKEKIRFMGKWGCHRNTYRKSSFEKFTAGLFSKVSFYRTPETVEFAPNIIVECMV